MGGGRDLRLVRALEVERVQLERRVAAVDGVLAAVERRAAPVEVQLREDVVVEEGAGAEERPLVLRPLAAEDDWFWDEI